MHYGLVSDGLGNVPAGPNCERCLSGVGSVGMGKHLHQVCPRAGQAGDSVRPDGASSETTGCEASPLRPALAVQLLYAIGW